MSDIECQAKLEILRFLKQREDVVVSREICSHLTERGLELSPRTVRLYLQHLEDEGMVEPTRRGRASGRTITERGLAEIDSADAVGRLGFIVARIDHLACRMTWHPRTAPDGTVILNLTMIQEAQAIHALREMAAIFQAGLGMGEKVALFPAGSRLEDKIVPPGYFGIGTVCGVTLNGALLRSGVPVASEFGAVLEMQEGRPRRFTDLVTYAGTTLDPLEVFIKARLSQVHLAAISGNGRIGASFRQFPSVATEAVLQMQQDMKDTGLNGILCIGKPNRPLLEFPVHDGRTALIVAGGLNPAAAIEEVGIKTVNSALSILYPANRLIHYQEMQREAVSILH